MYPYTADGIAAKEAAATGAGGSDVPAAGAGAGAGAGTDTAAAGNGGSAAGSAAAAAAAAAAASAAGAGAAAAAGVAIKPGDAGLPSLSPEDCNYILKGVLVHHGTANSGHYYSVIQQRDSDPAVEGGAPKWLRFNDHNVHSFAPEQLASETFGGRSTRRQTSRGRQVATYKEFSAFMLFYDKVPPGAAAEAAGVAAALAPPTNARVAAVPRPRPFKRRRSRLTDEAGSELVATAYSNVVANGVLIPACIAAQVTKENMTFWLEHHLFQSSAHSFATDLLDVVKACSVDDDDYPAPLLPLVPGTAADPGADSEGRVQAQAQARYDALVVLATAPAPRALAAGGAPLRVRYAALLFNQLFTFDSRVRHASATPRGVLTVAALVRLMVPHSSVDVAVLSKDIQQLHVEGPPDYEVCEALCRLLCADSGQALWLAFVGHVIAATRPHRVFVVALVQCLALLADAVVDNHVMKQSPADDDPLGLLLPGRPVELSADDGVPRSAGAGAGAGAAAGPAAGAAAEAEPPAALPPTPPAVAPTSAGHCALLCLDAIIHGMSVLMVPSLTNWYEYSDYWAALEAMCQSSVSVAHLFVRYKVLSYTMVAIHRMDHTLQYQGSMPNRLESSVRPIPKVRRSSRHGADPRPVMSALAAMLRCCRIADTPVEYSSPAVADGGGAGGGAGGGGDASEAPEPPQSVSSTSSAETVPALQPQTAQAAPAPQPVHTPRFTRPTTAELSEYSPLQLKWSPIIPFPVWQHVRFAWLCSPVAVVCFTPLTHFSLLGACVSAFRCLCVRL